MSRRPYNIDPPSAPTRRTPRAHGVAVAIAGSGGMSAKRCRFGRGPGLVEGIDV